ncbi:uncharacterized protein LOC119738785 [Patiria miniata]|uniref:Receptor protein-tyrosine kinase n=1 Tax=Patiria miniata TaxID=46514 RepID=A0A914B186_PATMI|nr:uncharacterized protein LOC119738785 [Patiria miniata]
MEGANVVCRQLGYLSADSALPRAFFGEGSGVIHLDQVTCEGRESELAFCNHARWGENQCEHGQDTSVVCTAPLPKGVMPDGSVRLVGGEAANLAGRLQVVYQGVWGTVCRDNWLDINSDVACKQLGYRSAHPARPAYDDPDHGSSSPIMLSEVSCSGDEERLVDCSHGGWAVSNCTHDGDVGITCMDTRPTTPGPETTSRPVDVITTVKPAIASPTFGKSTVNAPSPPPTPHTDAPVFTANSCPSPISRVAEPRSMVTMVTWTDPTATDNVAPTLECTPASGTNFMIGPTPVTCTATDAVGNEATPECTFTVTVTVPAKPLPLVVSDNSTNHITETTIKLRIAPVSQRNGPVSCVEVTVIRLTDEEGIEGKDPDVLYHPDLLRSFDKAQESTGLPYVAMVFKANDLSESAEIEIGSSGKSSCGGSRRKKRQMLPSHSGENGPLIPKTKYTAFIRAYVILDNQMEDYITSPLLKPVWTDPSGTGNTAVIAVVSVVSTTLIIALIACGVRVWIRRKKRRNKYSPPKRTSIKMDRIDYDDVSLPEDGMTSTVYEDVGLPSWALRWEILWKNLVVDDKVLGQGNFGEVRSGTVNIGGRMTKTAIKILKGHASKTDREDFMEEFRTMTNIGYHPNVVSLLGACQHEDVLYVALEYLPNGDLRSYLRTARSQSESDEGALSSEMLIKFALDVAKGMNHLSLSGVIHRDLAARNILLGEQLVAKVSDFGLSRGEDTYVQTSTRRVPTRWLAIESLLDRTYTTQSDVWSFGILLWEIASIGGTPYPAITTRSLVGRLMEGYRMTKPANCDKQIYSLMLRCWEEDPSNRPSFSDLIRILSKMDENKIEQTYMAIDRAHYENFCVIRPELDDN